MGHRMRAEKGLSVSILTRQETALEEFGMKGREGMEHGSFGRRRGEDRLAFSFK